jgi:hypothetical protein
MKKKPEYIDENMTPKKWEALLARGMTKIRAEYAAKQMPMHKLVAGDVVAVLADSSRHTKRSKIVATKADKMSKSITVISQGRSL